MAPRIPYRPLQRLAQSRGPANRTPARCFQARAPITAPSQQVQRFSTSPAQGRESRRPPDNSSEFAPLDSAHSPPPTASSQPPSPAAAPHISFPPPPPRPPATNPKDTPRRTRRLISNLILAIPTVAFGVLLGLALDPPAPAEPDSPAEQKKLAAVKEQAARIAAALQLDAEHGWEESWEAYESLSPEHRAQHLTAGPALAGTRGVTGYQRVWRHRPSGTFQTLVYIGGAASGWPLVAHGGLLATLLDEACGRAAFREWGGRGGLTAKLQANYLRKSGTDCFYLVRSRVKKEHELPPEERGKRHYKLYVDAAIIDPRDGKENVTAAAVFIAPGAKKEGEGRQEGGSKLVWDDKAKEGHLRF